MSNNRYKEVEKKIADSLGSLFRRAGRAVGNFFRSLFRAGRQKFTVMFIPHSEKKVFNFKISVFALVFMGFMFGAMMIVFVVVGARFSGIASLLNDRSKNLAGAQGNLEVLQDEIAGLRKVAQSFEASLASTMDKLNLQSSSRRSTLSLTGDLSAFYFVEEQEEGVLRELGDLRSMGLALQDSIQSLEKISGILTTQEALLVEMPTYWPVDNGDGRISGRFGPAINPFDFVWYLHKGLDIVYGYGKPILAAANGKVIEQKNDPPNFGLYVVLHHNYGFQTMYAHMQTVYVKAGDNVTQGQVIGTMGSSGKSTGPHLHFEVRIGTQVVDPERFLNIREKTR
ncbi:MAG: M23 family metallopeptidase [Spirochaetales bacterium]|nr:M23 family metallopeptidase [Spirochaetales bacterium]